MNIRFPEKLREYASGIARDSRGFTLAEMLTVLATMGIMATFAMPALGGAKTTTQSTAGQQDLNQIEKAMGKFQNAFSQDLAYRGTSTNSALAAGQITNYTQAAASYGLPLGCYLPPSASAVAPFEFQTVCGTDSTRFPYQAELNKAVYAIDVDQGMSGAGWDEVYFLDFGAKLRQKDPKTGAFILGAQQFVPNFMKSVPGTDMLKHDPAKDPALPTAAPLVWNSTGTAANDRYTGDADHRWVVRVYKGALNPNAHLFEADFRLEVWKQNADKSWTWNRSTKEVSLDTTPAVPLPSTWKVTSLTVETRWWGGQTPASAAAAKTNWENATPANGNGIVRTGMNGYSTGPAALAEFNNVSNQINFRGTNSNIAFHHVLEFDVPATVSTLSVRVGPDFGGYGTLNLDGESKAFRSNDMWWGGSYGNASQILQFENVAVTPGHHVIDVYGYEGCCDGPQQIQFKLDSGSWTTFKK